MPTPATHYDVLGVPPDASVSEIKQAVRKGQRRHHPDVVGDSPEHKQAYLDITAAAEVLLDPERRADYDASLSATPSTKPSPQEQVFTPEQPGRQPLAKNPTPDESFEVIDEGVTLRDLGASWIAGLLLCLIPARHHLVGTLEFSALGGLVGLIASWSNARSIRTTLFQRGYLRAVVSRIIAGVLCLVWVVVGFVAPAMIHTAKPELSAMVTGLGAVGWTTCAAFMVSTTMRQRREDKRVVTADALREFAWFGTEHGGADGAYLSRALRTVCADNVRVCQLRHPVFTHLVIAGHRAIFLRYLDGPSGHYRFSGDALLVTVPDGSIHEACRVDFAAVMAGLEVGLLPSYEVSGHLVMGGATVESDSLAVIGLDALGDLVNIPESRFSRSMMIDLLLNVARTSVAQ